MGNHSLKRRAKQFKRSIVKGVGKTFDKHRILSKPTASSSDASSSSTTTSSYGRPLIRRSRRNNDVALSKLYCFGKKKSDAPDMIAFATSGSTLIAASYSDDNGERTKQHHIHSELYRASSAPVESQVVHPVMCKRDIYIGSNAQKVAAHSKVKKKKDPEPSKCLVAVTDPPASEEEMEHTRQVMDDLSNSGPPKANSLASYSITGSMMYRNMEQNKTKAAVTQSMMSPQKPIGLPANSVMASMLFRTLETSGSVPELKSSSSNADADKKKPIVPTTVFDSSETSVSSMTMGSANHMDPMLRASNMLVSRILGGEDEEASESQQSLFEA